jgi:hypothetical protein
MLFRKKAKSPIVYNVTYKLRDKDGNLKPIFQPNKITQFLVKKGLLSPLHIKSFLFGSWGAEARIANLITNAGMAGAASRLNGAGSEAAFTYIALGTGTNAANVANTALQTEITADGGERANSSASRVTTAQTNDTARLNNEFSFTGTFAITESGVLNAGSGGVLLARQEF